MSTSALFRCDEARVPAALSKLQWGKRVDIRRLGDSNLSLRIENVSHALKGRLSPTATDLVHIAAYVYAADQLISRGGPTEVFGDGWRRDMHLCIPVRDPDLWSQPQVRESLASVLHFASDDHWGFTFSPAPVEEEQLAFQGIGSVLMGEPDSVFLFSGGADSLCAVVEEIAVKGGRPVLVSHRPTTATDHRQRRLRALLAQAPSAVVLSSCQHLGPPKRL